MEALVKNDQIGFVKGTLDRRRDPRRAGRQPDHPARAGPRRADARRHGPAAQGGAPGRAPRAAAPRRPGPARQPRPLSRDHRPGAGPPGDLQGRRRLRVRYDDRLIADLETAVGAGPRPPARPSRGHHADRRRHRPPSGAAHRPPTRSFLAASSGPTSSPMKRRPTTPTTCRVRSRPGHAARADRRTQDARARSTTIRTISITRRPEIPNNTPIFHANFTRGHAVKRTILSADDGIQRVDLRAKMRPGATCASNLLCGRPVRSTPATA